MAKIRELSAGRTPSRDDFNKLAREINRQGKIRGRNGITVNSTPVGISLVGGGASSTDSGSVRWASLTEDATSTDNIAGNLLDVTTGIAGDSATNGVYFEMINSTRTDMCMPRFSEDDIVPVVQRAYDSAGTAVTRWYYNGNLMGSDDWFSLD